MMGFSLQCRRPAWSSSVGGKGVASPAVLLRGGVAAATPTATECPPAHPSARRPARASESSLPDHQPAAGSLLAVTQAASNGMVAGFVNKVKVVKCILFGKAGFPLLRQQVPHAL